MKRIVIIGNGIAGITAARHIRKRSDDPITVLSAESDHFFSRTALMYIYMGHMAYENTKPYEDFFWEKSRIDLLREYVQKVDPEGKQLHLGGGRTLDYDVLVLATGSKSNRFGWPGQNLPGVQSLYSLQDLQLLEENTEGLERAVLVGGGLIGIELAEMLRSRKIDVTFLVREPRWMNFAFPREESEMIGAHIREHHVDLRFSTELERIEAGGDGRAAAVVTKDGETIPCQLVGLTAGVSPNVGFLTGSGIECDRGILVDDSLRTNYADVYAAGDCAQLRSPKPGRRPVEPLWYTGRMMGETLAYTICGKETAYDPGTWFNSAKFMDLEWQVYGQVPAEPGDGEATLFWQHESGKKSLRINYLPEDESAADGPVLGFNVMGIRYRHELCQQWLEEERGLRYVLENLGAANFDPELYDPHEKDLVAVYNRRHPDSPLSLKQRRGWRQFLRLRKAG